jgi:hypothetical protein
MRYASFIVRLWRLAGSLNSEMPVSWHSEVEHIQSGQTWKFSTFDQLIGFLKQQAENGIDLGWVELQELESK